MGEHVNKDRSQSDLLSLIGQAIQSLQQSIDQLESQKQAEGLRHLAQVIEDIDEYLVRLDEDPLLQLAAVDPSHLERSLHRVQDDLGMVIDSVRESVS